MPYKDKERHREYQRQRIARIRANWLSQNGPCVDCGSPDDLEVDHVDPKSKVDHKVWSWSEARRAEELAKCVVRCSECHKRKTASDRRARMRHGTNSMYRKAACRCPPCVEAYRAYKRDYKRRKKVAGGSRTH